MTSPKEVHNARPTTYHRLSLGFMPSGVLRQSASRPHSHSVSLGQINQVHRVNRRKSSMSVNGVNMAALAAAVEEASLDTSSPYNIGQASHAFVKSSNAGNSASPTADIFPSSVKDVIGFMAQNSSAIVDGPPLSTMLGTERGSTKARTRRASEGSRLIKSEKIRSNAGELRCETCGKGYKHGSCLTKHLWEHTPEWAVTSKLLISKHQQVQLLEAASVLVTMNQAGSAPLVPSSQLENEMSSDSPGASGSSEPRDDDDSSSRTSTPSQQDETVAVKTMHFSRPRRQDSYSSAFSRSYQSTSAASFAASSAPNDNGFSFYRQWSSNPRRQSIAGHSSNGSQYDSDEQADVAAAAEGLLSCSLGPPKTGPFQSGSDIPPVPPLPARFAQQNESRRSDFTASPRVARQFGLAYSHHSDYQPDIDMEDDEIFGHMEQ